MCKIRTVITCLINILTFKFIIKNKFVCCSHNTISSLELNTNEVFNSTNIDKIDYNNVIYFYNYLSYNNINYKNTIYNPHFPNLNSEVLIYLTMWQYWWWFWFVFLSAFYYIFLIKSLVTRQKKFNPRINTSLKSHGKWGDLIVGLIPIYWCLNILINSNFLLKTLEWQTESNVFTIRIKGKQWYWVYKIDTFQIDNLLRLSKNVGHNNILHEKYYNNEKKIYNFFIGHLWNYYYFNQLKSNLLLSNKNKLLGNSKYVSNVYVYGTLSESDFIENPNNITPIIDNNSSDTSSPNPNNSSDTSSPNPNNSSDTSSPNPNNSSDTSSPNPNNSSDTSSPNLTIKYEPVVFDDCNNEEIKYDSDGFNQYGYTKNGVYDLSKDIRTVTYFFLNITNYNFVTEFNEQYVKIEKELEIDPEEGKNFWDPDFPLLRLIKLLSTPTTLPKWKTPRKPNFYLDHDFSIDYWDGTWLYLDTPQLFVPDKIKRPFFDRHFNYKTRNRYFRRGYPYDILVKNFALQVVDNNLLTLDPNLDLPMTPEDEVKVLLQFESVLKSHVRPESINGIMLYQMNKRVIRYTEKPFVYKDEWSMSLDWKPCIWDFLARLYTNKNIFKIFEPHLAEDNFSFLKKLFKIYVNKSDYLQLSLQNSQYCPVCWKCASDWTNNHGDWIKLRNFFFPDYTWDSGIFTLDTYFTILFLAGRHEKSRSLGFYNYIFRKPTTKVAFSEKKTTKTSSFNQNNRITLITDPRLEKFKIKIYNDNKRKWFKSLKTNHSDKDLLIYLNPKYLHDLSENSSNFINQKLYNIYRNHVFINNMLLIDHLKKKFLKKNINLLDIFNKYSKNSTTTDINFTNGSFSNKFFPQSTVNTKKINNIFELKTEFKYNIYNNNYLKYKALKILSIKNRINYAFLSKNPNFVKNKNVKQCIKLANEIYVYKYLQFNRFKKKKLYFYKSNNIVLKKKEIKSIFNLKKNTLYNFNINVKIIFFNLNYFKSKGELFYFYKNYFIIPKSRNKISNKSIILIRFNDKLSLKFGINKVKSYPNNMYFIIKQLRVPFRAKSLNNKSFIISNSFYKYKNNVNIYNNFNKINFSSLDLSKRLITTNFTVVLPCNLNMVIITNSYDVIHSWFIPGIGVKMDCVPGRSTHHTFYFDTYGMFIGQCAEICGRFHHHMPIRLALTHFDIFMLWVNNFLYYFIIDKNHKK